MRRADPPRSDARLSLSGQDPRVAAPLQPPPNHPPNVNMIHPQGHAHMGMATAGSGADGWRAPTEFPGIRRNNDCDLRRTHGHSWYDVECDACRYVDLSMYRYDESAISVESRRQTVYMKHTRRYYARLFVCSCRAAGNPDCMRLMRDSIGFEDFGHVPVTGNYCTISVRGQCRACARPRCSPMCRPNLT